MISAIGRWIFGLSFLVFVSSLFVMTGHMVAATQLWVLSVLMFLVGAGLWIAGPKRRR